MAKTEYPEAGPRKGRGKTVSEKRPYETPKAVFIALKIEERIMSCGKYPPPQGKVCNPTTFAMS
jgi:hypothetical protein